MGIFALFVILIKKQKTEMHEKKADIILAYLIRGFIYISLIVSIIELKIYTTSIAIPIILGIILFIESLILIKKL
jgi:hypothetical protein